MVAGIEVEVEMGVVAVAMVRGRMLSVEGGGRRSACSGHLTAEGRNPPLIWCRRRHLHLHLHLLLCRCLLRRRRRRQLQWWLPTRARQSLRDWEVAVVGAARGRARHWQMVTRVEGVRTHRHSRIGWWHALCTWRKARAPWTMRSSSSSASSPPAAPPCSSSKACIRRSSGRARRWGSGGDRSRRTGRCGRRG